MAILDCSDGNTAINSLAKIYNVSNNDIMNFLFTKIHEVVSYPQKYDEIYDINELHSYLFGKSCSGLNIQSIIVFHLTTDFVKESIEANGLINLYDIGKSDNFLRNYLANHDVNIESNKGQIEISYQNRPIKCDNSLYNRRLRKDHCINGFLYNNEIEEDSNVKHLIECPEIVQNISECVKCVDLKRDWKGNPIIVKFKVGLRHLNIRDTGNWSMETEKELEEHLILNTLNYILNWLHNDLEHYSNKMIFLKENYSVPPEDIVDFLELEKLNISS
ncbi:hypothetical protein SAMN05421734_102490 [Pelagirhabdus alkalitolerans]|uniref:Uncharacterized protein n=1 Tax=Pelagirhabdus alkalitolerans TaxID=1612202 RepID=A0A1G6HCN2_9BACI|nr:hypothetical protein [Pelagirhabdus alkalitolerans]SDB92039.1 hypothetical protein SAMN05421734_102490 [Pelagirhabdus alkalitolerans]